jgi:hypothetical protein
VESIRRAAQRFGPEPVRWQRAIGALTAAVVITACGGQAPDASETAATASGSAAAAQPVTEVELPAPPPALELGDADPKAQATALVDGILGPREGRLAAWLAAYDALGVPVLDTDGSAVGSTEDDPVGLPYWRVWYSSVLSNADSGFPLTDFARFFSVPDEAPFDSSSAAPELLDDLRAAIASSDPQVRLFGELVAELVRRGPEPAELADPELTADAVVLTGGTADLLAWVVIRNLTFAVAQAEVASAPAWRSVQSANAVLVAAHGPSSGGEVSLAAPAPGKCSEFIINEDVTYWVNWVTNKIGGGFQLPGMLGSTKGFVELVQDYLGVNLDFVEKTKKVTAAAGMVTSILTLALQIGALQLDGFMDPQPLKRTDKTQSDGAESVIYLKLSSNLDDLLNGDQTWACVTTFVLNAFGVTLGLPPSGNIVGAEIGFEAGQGVGDYVLFRDAEYRRATTNDKGEVKVTMIGAAQKRELPKGAQPYIREFSIKVSGQPTAVTATTLFDIFFAGLTFGVSPSTGGLVGAAVEIAKTIKWDLGEHFFPLRDWASYKMRMELIGILPASALGGLDGQFTIDGLAEIPLTVGDDGRVTGSGPMEVLFAASYNIDNDVVCEGNGETTLTIDVEGNVADEMLHVKTTWSGPPVSGSVTCRVEGESFSQPLSTPPWGGDMGALTSGFDMRLAEGESVTHTVPNPAWDITVIVTIVRDE